ncbi:MAG TPA: hypothetical protein ENL03_05355, partial [Phycisphaerae bacterium]|nr:hypothetical protein [Phycisphaerae bacterium]
MKIKPYSRLAPGRCVIGVNGHASPVFACSFVVTSDTAYGSLEFRVSSPAYCACPLRLNSSTATRASSARRMIPAPPRYLIVLVSRPVAGASLLWVSLTSMVDSTSISPAGVDLLASFAAEGSFTGIVGRDAKSTNG